ncbi:MAG: DUF1080 domain-containing protein [Acidobacteria bacterium]|nr:DUF1080 domain-containing protein [Acidobacteriota bacterium]MDA1234180.1 DUF1080 domain-containing protein [Acidobacteriota bacterium]
MLRHTLLLTALCAAFLGCSPQAAEPQAAEPEVAEHNTLTAEEQAAGWQLLFDGKTYDGLTGMKGSPLPEAHWTIEDGTLRTIPGPSRDLVTTRTYENFELTFDAKIMAGGNSGLKYLVRQEWSLNPDKPSLAAVGHEYQVLDDATLKGEPGWEKSSFGSFYLVYAPDKNKNQSPFGEWNECRVIVDGDHVEHWLNGDMILEYELGTDEVLALVQQTKFLNVPGFGTKAPGYIVLTHHNGDSWFRSVKIRELP